MPGNSPTQEHCCKTTHLAGGEDCSLVLCQRLQHVVGAGQDKPGRGDVRRVAEG